MTNAIKLTLLVWMVCEMLVFALVAHWIGTADAILIGVITSIFGFSLLRRAGTAALMKLRTRLDGRPLGAGDKHHFLDETLATIGAVALLLPGFLSDIVGLGLAIPALRDKIVGWVRRGGLKGVTKRATFKTDTFKADPFKADPFKADPFKADPFKADPFKTGPRPQHGPSTIDLAPEEWRHTDPAKPSVSKV